MVVRWRQVTDFITESLINLICLKADSFGNKLFQCVYYPPYLLQRVLNMTNIIFRMHTGTQAVTVFMNDNLIDSLDSFH